MAALTDLIAEPGRAALFFDVDGVLAPIVERPADARVPEETRAELRRLAARYALVACVTGRPSAVARELVGVESSSTPASTAWSSTRRRPAGPRGSTRSRRGRMRRSSGSRCRSPTTTGRAADPDAARRRWRRWSGPRPRRASARGGAAWCSRSCRRVDASKGTAVRHLLAAHGLDRALYAGDDTTDLDGFAALDGLEVAVRVAVASSEGPAELRERADIVLPSSDAVLGFLRGL